jgi:hypothetical protein
VKGEGRKAKERIDVSKVKGINSKLLNSKFKVQGWTMDYAL